MNENHVYDMIIVGGGPGGYRKTYKNCKDKEGTDTGSCIRKGRRYPTTHE